MYGLKDKYDFAFSLGAACPGSMSLRKAGMQYASFPLDWLSAASIAEKVGILLGGAYKLIAEDRLRIVEGGSGLENGCDAYQDTVTGICFYHDFPRGVALADSVAAIRAKYERRSARWTNLMGESKSVLAVFVDLVLRPSADEALVAARKTLSAAYPSCEIDLLCVTQSKEALSVSKISDGVFRLTADYEIRKPGVTPQADAKIVAKLLKKVVAEISDYRTDEDRKSFRAKQRKKRFALYNAGNYPEYLVHRVYWKLFRHFKNVCERKGINGAG